MRATITATIWFVLLVPLLAGEKDAAFFLKLRDAKDADADKGTRSEIDIFEYYGQSLGAKISCKSEGGASQRGGGNTWGRQVERRIVEGGFLVETTIPPEHLSIDPKFAFLPMTVTWFDTVSFPTVAIRRVILTDRGGSIVLLERWSGVLWFSQNEPRVQWLRYADHPSTRTYESLAKIPPRQLKKGDFIGCAFEDLDKEGFSVVYTVEPAGSGVEAWRETRWK